MIFGCDSVSGEEAGYRARRTDREPVPTLSESKVVLYGTQGGNCSRCGAHFLPQHLTVDHIIARSKGGTDHLDNLQLLCGHCNSLKGDRPMEYLRARLVRGRGLKESLGNHSS